MAIYSHSKIGTCESCPQKYKFGYIDKIKGDIASCRRGRRSGNATESTRHSGLLPSSMGLAKILNLLRRIVHDVNGCSLQARHFWKSHRSDVPRLIAPGPSLPRSSSTAFANRLRFSSVRLNNSL